MVIQWFPGHMTKALRMMEKEIKIVDAIIYVLDSRAPFSCVNPKLNSLVIGKPIIYILNNFILSVREMSDSKTLFLKKFNGIKMIHGTTKLSNSSSTYFKNCPYLVWDGFNSLNPLKIISCNLPSNV